MDPIIQFSRQQRIVNTLLLNASFIDNPGLMHGKMGIAIYFYHLATETSNSVYEDYAGELIDEIYEEIHAKTPCDFENGLAGIGCGIEYLVQNKFIDADTNEVLEEFDNQIIHEITFHTPTDIGILNGISGYILYFYYRLRSNKTNAIFSKSLSDALIITFGLLKQHIIDLPIWANPNTIWRQPDTFDLIWEYPATIWALSKLIELQICTDEVKQLISQLLIPIVNKGILPKLFSHRLLLSLVVEELKHINSETFSDLDSDKVIQKLLNALKHEHILKELADKSASIQNGTSGIAFIYQRLFHLTKNPAFNVEYEYWENVTYELPESDQGYGGFFIEKEKSNMAYGLLNGIAGINFVDNGKN